MAKLIQLKDKEGYVYPEISPSYKALLGTLQLKSSIGYGTDFNNLKETGIYWYNGWIGSGGANRPTDTKQLGIIVVFAMSDKYFTQVAFFHNACWYRCLFDTDVTAWVRLG